MVVSKTQESHICINAGNDCTGEFILGYVGQMRISASSCEDSSSGTSSTVLLIILKHSSSHVINMTVLRSPSLVLHKLFSFLHSDVMNLMRLAFVHRTCFEAIPLLNNLAGE